MVIKLFMTRKIVQKLIGNDLFFKVTFMLQKPYLDELTERPRMRQKLGEIRK